MSTDTMTLDLELTSELIGFMNDNNPYVQNLIEMGYDESDCRMVADAGKHNVTYPRNIHGRIFNTQKEYDDALADFINGL